MVVGCLALAGDYDNREPSKVGSIFVSSRCMLKPPKSCLKIPCSGSAVPFVRRQLNLKLIYFPSIPFFTCAVGGFGPNHTEKITCPNAGPAMVSLSWPLMAKVVPVPGT